MNLSRRSILLIFFQISILCFNLAIAVQSTSTIVGDVIIVGGGTGGLTAAYVLATETNLNVHVLEAGDDPTSYDPDIDIPLKLFNVSQNPQNEWGFVSTPLLNAGNAKVDLPRFKGLGGCSQHNGEGFWIGSEFNYNKWPEGFRYKDFNKAAREFEGCVSFGAPNHGTTGPLYTKLDDLDQIDPYLKAWKKAALQSGYLFNPDENAPLAKGYMPHIFSIKDGARFGPYHAFKTIMGKLPNLHVHLNTMATKILFSGKDGKGKLKINGVEADNVDSKGVTHKLRFLANKAVILSAGALQTPQLLMVSGIGDRKVLRKAGIREKLHLPGVGKNLRDHVASLFVINSKQTPPINDPVFFKQQADLYAATRQGYFGYPVADHSAVRTSSNGDKLNPNVPADIVLSTTCYTFIPGFEQNQILSVVVLTDEQSAGTVTVSSGSVYDPPVTDLNFFSCPEDFKVMQKGFDLMREIFNQPALCEWFDFEIFPDGLDDVSVKSQVLTTDHLMGTCMLGDECEDFAVVGKDGVVFGTSGLYVADASAIRTVGGALPNASIHGTVILLAKIVAEKVKDAFCH